MHASSVPKRGMEHLQHPSAHGHGPLALGREYMSILPHQKGNTTLSWYDLLEGPLQNQTAAPQVPTAIKAPPVVQEPSMPVVSSDLCRTVGPQVTASRESLNSSQEANRELQPVVELAAMQIDSSGPQPAPKVNLTPQPSLPVLRRSSCFITTPKRLNTEIQGTVPCLWTAN